MTLGPDSQFFCQSPGILVYILPRKVMFHRRHWCQKGRSFWSEVLKKQTVLSNVDASDHRVQKSQSGLDTIGNQPRLAFFEMFECLF